MQIKVAEEGLNLFMSVDVHLYTKAFFCRGYWGARVELVLFKNGAIKSGYN